MSESLEKYIKRAFNQLSGTTRIKTANKQQVRVPKLDNSDFDGWLYSPKSQISYAFAFPTIEDSKDRITIAFYFGTNWTTNPTGTELFRLNKYAGVTLVFNRSDLSLDSTRSGIELYEGSTLKATIAPPVPRGIPNSLGNGLTYSLWAVDLALKLIDKFSTDSTSSILGLEAAAEVIIATTALAVVDFANDKGSDATKTSIKAAEANVTLVIDVLKATGWSSTQGSKAYEKKSKGSGIRMWRPTFATDGTVTLFLGFFDRIIPNAPDQDHMVVSFEIVNAGVVDADQVVDYYTVADIKTDNHKFTVTRSGVDANLFDEWSADLEAKVAGLGQDSKDFAKEVIAAVADVVGAIS